MMGGLSSKQSSTINHCLGRNMIQEKQHSPRGDEVLTTPSNPTATVEKQMVAKEPHKSVGDDQEEIYDGISRYQRCLYQRSRSVGGTNRTTVSEVSSRLRRVSSTGLVKAAEVLGTLGINVGGLVSKATIKGTKLSILSFEVGNMLVKASSLLESLSERSVRQLKELVLPEEGVQRLVSDNMDELLRIVASDKREELKALSDEVIRYGNLCKDPQWHNMDRFFEKRRRDNMSHNRLRATVESVMQQLKAPIQLMAELYKEMHALERFEHDHRLMFEEIKRNTAQRGDNSLHTLTTELKTQRKLVKNLKKKSLWYRSMEEIMEKLVDLMLFMYDEINISLLEENERLSEEGTIDSQRRLGASGLALHYANIILQIDTIVAHSGSVPLESLETLYKSLPLNVRDSLRTKLQSFHVEEELNETEIQDEMEKTLHWLVPIATNTTIAHPSVDRVGEWASAESELICSQTVWPVDAMKIETLHHADKEKTEAYILDLLLWLNYSVTRFSKASNEDQAIPVCCDKSST